MKNFSHLYHQTSKNPFPKKTSTNKAVLNSSGINTFSKNSSMRTFNQFNTLKNSNNPKKQRLSSKSIQQHNGRNLDEERYNKTHKKQIYVIQNEEDDPNELFKESYKKIGMIRQNFNNHAEIDYQLNQILKLIREERQKMKETMQTMKKELQLGKEKYIKEYKDYGANTEEIIQCIQEKLTLDHGMQTEENIEKQEQENSQPLETVKVDEVYKKLTIMLYDMGIDSMQILPPHNPPNLEKKEFKKLSEGQIIKIQKFLIKKLAQKVHK